ncbi:MAG: hypothetical protein J5974_00800, partial [Pyramidobacter sp.]|nr:hypothetical protein [Pyramidobacter sp.]
SKQGAVDNVTVIGKGNSVDNLVSSVVIGSGNNIKMDKSQTMEHVYVLGSNVTAAKVTSNSVFLGNGAAYITDSKYTAGREVYNSPDYANGTGVAGVVAVGSGDWTRRIQGVAPGLIGKHSTDAINGSQLYEVQQGLVWSADVDAADGGRVSAAIGEQRIGASEGNKGIVHFVAGAGIVISTDNTDQFKMTFGVNRAADPQIVSSGAKPGSLKEVAESHVYWDAKQVQKAVNDTYWTLSDGTDAGKVQVHVGDTVKLSGGTGISVDYDSAAGGIKIEAHGTGVSEYSGDFGPELDVTGTLYVKGNAAKSADLTDGNIGVVGSLNGDDGTLTVKLNKDIDLTKDGSVTVGDTKVTNDGLTITGGPSVTKTGIDAGSKKIFNVANGEVSENSKEAVNGSQLWEVAQNAGGSWYLAAGENADTEKEEIAKNNTVKFIVGEQPDGSDNLFIERAEKTVKFTIKENPVFAGTVKATGGFDANGKKVTNVAAGDVSSDSRDAVNGSQLFETAQSVAETLGGGADGKNGKVTGFKVTMKADAANTSGNPKNYETVAAALNATDSTLYNMTQHFTTRQLSVEGDATVGGTFTARGPAHFHDTVYMHNNKITGLAPGEIGPDSTDAVNGSQLYAMGQRIDNRVGDMYNTLNNDIREVGSRAAALAGLHAPMYRPERRTGFNAALGFYRGDTTLAMGLTHYFSEDSMISAAATVGHKPMVNVGWSVRLGRGDMVIKTTRRRVDEHEVRNADLEARVQELEKRLGVSPKVDHHPEKITGRVPLDQRVSDLELSAAPVSAKSDVDAKLDEILRKRAARKRRSGK